jgi:hypothetical protein
VQRIRFTSFVDVTSVAIISLATVFSAWCGYQATLWSGVQSEQYHLSSVARTRASEQLARANVEELYDRHLFVQYMISNINGARSTATYIRSLFRPEARGVIDRWLAMPATNRRGLRTPFAMKEYHPTDRALAVRFNDQANEFFDSALYARRRSDRYVLLTVLFASVSFLGGISTKLRPPFHLIMVCFGALVLTGAAVLILFFPID